MSTLEEKDTEEKEKIKILAASLIFNEVDVCGLGMLNAIEVAEEVLKFLNSNKYDIIKLEEKTK